MPASDKTRRKATARKPSPRRTRAEVPDRAQMEAFLATGRDNVEAANDRAQELIYEAWEMARRSARMERAYRALGISPLCADAYNLLAEDTAQSLAEKRAYYELALHAAALSLGPEGFKEYAGHFWGFLETRPYMRARAGVALALRKSGDLGGAIAHYRAMLDLNPNDNQGIRYELMSCLLQGQNDAGLKALIADYADEWGAFWLYTRTLIAFRDSGPDSPEAIALVAEARSTNHHVPAILAGKEPPVVRDDGYYAVGGPDEATYYVMECGEAWRKTPGAVAWLERTAAALPQQSESPGTLH